MIETQKHWWQPAPKVLGWHIGFWNLIGGFGSVLRFPPCSDAHADCFQVHVMSRFWFRYQQLGAISSIVFDLLGILGLPDRKFDSAVRVSREDTREI